jgi:hypothetical protein
MLDLKLVAYLREHPDVFSDVIAHLLRGPDGRYNVSFGGKRKGDQVGEKETKKRREEAPVGPNLWEDVLVEDVRTNEILKRLVQDVEQDERVLVDLLLLAMVSKNLRRNVKAFVEALETRIEVMPLYCRALFEYTREAATFNFFLERIEEHAPATHAAWLVMVRDDAVRSELGSCMDYLRRHRPRHFEAALANNGLDPIATALCMHHWARPGMGFSPVVVEKLRPFVLDKVWACFAMTWEDLAFVPMPADLAIEDAIHACTIRCALEGGVDFFMPLLQKLIENVDLGRPFKLKASKNIWKNLVRLDAGLPLRILRVLAQARGFQGPLDPEMFYQWLKASLVRNNDVGLDMAQAVFLNMNEGKLILENITSGDFHIRAILDAGARFLTRIRAILDAGARFLTRHSTPPTEFSDTIKHLVTNYSPYQVLYFALRGLSWAIQRGNRPFIQRWIDHIWPECKQLEHPIAFIRDVLDFLTDLGTVAKHDPDASLQTLLGKLFLVEFPFLIDHFRTSGLKRNVLCLGDALFSLLVQNLGDDPDDVAMRDSLEDGHWLFVVLQQESVEAIKRVLVGNGDDSESDGEYRVLAQWLYIAELFLKHRPIIARSLFDEVVEMAEAIRERGNDDDDMESWYSLFQGEISSEFRWRLVRSKYFTTIFPSFDSSLKRGVFVSLMADSSNTLLLGTKLLSFFNRRKQIVAVEDYVTQATREGNNPIAEQFVHWNLLFRCCRMGEFDFQYRSHLSSLKRLCDAVYTMEE